MKRPTSSTSHSSTYVFEYFEANPYLLEIKSTRPIPKGLETDSGSLSAANSEPGYRKKRHPFYEALAGIDGLQSAGLNGLTLQIERKIESREWADLLPKIQKAIKTHLSKDAVFAFAEKKPPQRTNGR